MAIFLVPGGGTSSPAGSDGQVQFNAAGLFGASSDLTWNNSTKVLTAAGDLNLTGLSAAVRINNSVVLQETALGSLVQIGGGNIPNGTITSDHLAGSIGDGKLAQITAANKVALSALDVDGAADLGADLADGDLLIVDDGATGTNRKAALTRVSDYVFAKVSGDLTIAANGSAVAPLASALVNGYLSSADFTKLGGIEAGAQVNVATDLSYTASSRLLASSTGADVSLPLADATNPGLLAAADFTKLGGIEAGAQVNVGTDLSYTASTRVLASSTGNDATLPLADAVNPGLLSAADFTKLGGIEAGAEVNVNADWNAGSGDAQILNKPTNLSAFGNDSGFITAAGAPVQSVNTLTGAVVLDADAIDDALTSHKFASQAELTKLGGIEAGAQVNVNADWNASSGDAQILNKPASMPPPDGDKGDVIVSDSGTNWLIDDAVVTTSKLGGDITAAGKALLDDADATAQRTTLGIGNVDNTSDLNKPVSTATQTALNLKADLASPALTGTPTAPTAAPGTNTTQIATTAFVLANGGGGSGVTDGDKGDITVSNSGATWKIDHGSARQLLQTNAGGTAVQWTSDVEIPGVLGIQAGSAGSPSLYFAGDSDTGIYSPAANELAITIGGTQRFYLTSVGEHKLYRDATSKAIGSITIGTAASNESLLSIGVSTSLDAAFLTSSQNGSGLVRPIVFGVGGSSEERLRIDTSGRVLIGTTNATSSGAKLQTVDGITFPATQVDSADANTLDDYEEGTFTPYIAGTSTAGTGTYSGQSGQYTKVGRLVHFRLFVGWTSHNGTGNMQITGLPFASNSTMETVVSVLANNLTTPASTFVCGDIDNPATAIRVKYSGLGTNSRTDLSMGDTSASLWVTGVYNT